MTRTLVGGTQVGVGLGVPTPRLETQPEARLSGLRNSGFEANGLSLPLCGPP